MSVQELKQLTSLRLASQNVPLHQSEITGLVSKAVLSNAAKSHYRESLRGGPLTPTTTPKPQQQQQQHPIQPQQQRGAMPRASNGMPIPSDGALGDATVCPVVRWECRPWTATSRPSLRRSSTRRSTIRTTRFTTSSSSRTIGIRTRDRTTSLVSMPSLCTRTHRRFVFAPLSFAVDAMLTQ
ncbi:hypothetical protein PINS_up016278 [Pythium insidiosum]|nr:hypothetical protein PINS_up016278 [Pythium insidiosum]